MREPGNIDDTMWAYPPFTKLTFLARLLLIYLQSCEEGNAADRFEPLYPVKIAPLLKTTPAEVAIAIQQLVEAGFITWTPGPPTIVQVHRLWPPGTP